MSTGGNVPSQGTTQEALSPQRKRGDRGILGNGTRSKRLKHCWRLAKKSKEDPFKGSLLEYARYVAVKYEGHPDLGDLVKDAEGWLDAKAHPPKRVPKPKAEKAADSKATINVPKKAAGRR